MDTLTDKLSENQRELDKLLGVGRNYDVINHDLYVGSRKGRLYVIDGYGDDGVIERITSFLLGHGRELAADAADMQDFINRCVTFCEVDCENDLDKIMKGAFIGKTILLLEGFDRCAMIDANKFPGRGVEEPSDGKVLRGSHDGFVEAVVPNMALLRRRIRDPNLTLENHKEGGRSRTDVVLAYMDDRVDQMFEALEQKSPNHFAVRQYKLFKLSAGKTAKSILISCGARLAPFDIAELREITRYDELELDTLGDRKTALFLIMSDTDSTFNFLISMIYTQLFNLLCEKADDQYHGRLPVHVRCLIDECANIGQIPNLEKLVATIRSREISACLVLQAQSQLKAIYKDNADTIIGNMDTRIFLGGSEPTTLKELSAALGKETIDMFNTGVSKGSQESHSVNYQRTGHELASVDELAVLDGGKCILQLRGVRPFLSDKYDLTKHPNFQYTADCDEKNRFDVEKFLDHRLKLRAKDEFEVIDADE